MQQAVTGRTDNRIQILTLPVTSCRQLTLCGSGAPQGTGPGSERAGAFCFSGICYASGMQDYDLPQIAIHELIRLSKQVGTPIEDRPEFQILWDERLIMGGDKRRVHVTQRGKSWLQRRGLIQ